MLSIAPSSSPAEHDIQLDMTADFEDEDPIPEWALPQNIDYEDPIPSWALPNHVVGNEIPLLQSSGLVFELTFGSSSSGSSSGSLVGSTSSSLANQDQPTEKLCGRFANCGRG
eukprot:6482803-Amphidinium_carterae.2